MCSSALVDSTCAPQCQVCDMRVERACMRSCCVHAQPMFDLLGTMPLAHVHAGALARALRDLRSEMCGDAFWMEQVQERVQQHEHRRAHLVSVRVRG